MIDLSWHGSNFITLTYQDGHGRTDQTVLGRDRESSLNVVKPGRTRAFDGDPGAWRLAAEALRIRYAALFDPMLAVTTTTSSRCRTRSRRSTARCCRARRCGSCSPTTLAPARRSWPASNQGADPPRRRQALPDRRPRRPGRAVAGRARRQVRARVRDPHARADRGQRSTATRFEKHPLIARLDQLSRNEDLQAKLEQTDWDLVVVDEAHRMSAHFFGDELKKTQALPARRAARQTSRRHLLLMTATPHCGKQEDFQLFLALLDPDRFEGKFRDGVHTVEPEDLMRRMVKEELLTFEGKPLFPERRAYTVPYDLSALTSRTSTRRSPSTSARR